MTTTRPDLILPLLDHLPLGIAVLDRAGRVVVSNPPFAELIGRPREQIEGRPLFEGAPLCSEMQQLEGAFWSASAESLDALDEEREFSLSTASGSRELHARLRGIRIQGEPFGLLLIDDNERVKRTERALAAALGEAQDQAVRDPLTGLFNRRHVESVLPAELKRAQRLGTPLSLLVLDLDHFKSINDRFGHPMGDLVLVGLARLLNRILRVGDTCARIGGEEFCVVLPHSDAHASLRAADRLQRVIRAQRFEEEPALRVTASIGVATTQLSAPQADFAREAKGLMARADQALYQAKAEGRDRTAVASEDVDTDAQR